MLKTVSKVFLTILTGLAIGLSSCTTKSITQEGLDSAYQVATFRGIVRLKTVDNIFFCSAAIISDTEALTATHCFGGLKSNEFMVESLPNADKSKLEVYASVVGFNGRADTAIIRGDFKNFDKFRIDTNPENDILLNNYQLVSCGFPYGGKVVCYEFRDAYKMVDGIAGKGQMYAGMSGGPVIDLKSGKIYAVNHGVGQGFVMIAPIINLRQSMRPVQ